MDKPVRIKATPDFMDSLIYSSCRYFVGRKTIQAACAASDLAKFFAENPDIMGPERKQFLAQDIRREINQQLQFCRNLTVEGYERPGKPDALTLWVDAVVKELEKTGKFFDRDRSKSPEGAYSPDWDSWTINIETGEVRSMVDVRSNTVGFSDIYELVLDLVPWIKLAGYLDPTELITAGDDDEILNAPGFAFPVIGRYINEEHHHIAIHHETVEQYIKNPVINSYVADEYIKSINSINQ